MGYAELSMVGVIVILIVIAMRDMSGGKNGRYSERNELRRTTTRSASGRFQAIQPRFDDESLSDANEILVRLDDCGDVQERLMVLANGIHSIRKKDFQQIAGAQHPQKREMDQMEALERLAGIFNVMKGAAPAQSSPQVQYYRRPDVQPQQNPQGMMRGA